MEIKTWKPGMTDAESKDVGYWERNMLALLLADGWYNDDIEEKVEPMTEVAPGVIFPGGGFKQYPRYAGWRRVLSLFGGRATFHIPDDFDIGQLKQIERNWDGHTTEEKWQRLWENGRLWNSKAALQFYKDEVDKVSRSIIDKVQKATSGIPIVPMYLPLEATIRVIKSDNDLIASQGSYIPLDEAQIYQNMPHVTWVNAEVFEKLWDEAPGVMRLRLMHKDVSRWPAIVKDSYPG